MKKLNLLILIFSFSLASFSQDETNDFYVLDSSLALGISFKLSEHLMYVTIFEKVATKWKQIQKIDSLESQFGAIGPQLIDFNCDGYFDLSIYCCSGGRGGNGYNYVFLKDSIKKTFYFLKGSLDIPNLTRNCNYNYLESMWLTGSTDYIDFKIVKDSLIKVQGVNISHFDKWTIKEYYKYINGEPLTYKIDSTLGQNDDIFNK